MLATTVATTHNTNFNHGLNVRDFFANDPVGETVSVRGTWDGLLLTADDVNIGDDNGDDDDNRGPGNGGDNGGDDGGKAMDAATAVGAAATTAVVMAGGERGG